MVTPASFSSACRALVMRSCWVLVATGSAALAPSAAARGGPDPASASAFATDSLLQAMANASPAPLVVAPRPVPLVLLERRGPLRADRLQHASLSFALASGAGAAGAHRTQAVSLTLLLGLAKEVRDARATRFDAWDLAADVAGAALGAWLLGRR